MNNDNDNQYVSFCNQMMDDPETIRLTINGVDIIVNKSHQYIGCLQKDVDMSRFVKVVLYLQKEGFFDEPEN